MMRHGFMVVMIIKTRRQPHNRKYMMYSNAAIGGPSHGRRQHAQKLVKFGRVVLELRERTDRQTDRQTYLSQYFALITTAT